MSFRAGTTHRAYELLTFLEFDFHAARQVGILDEEYLLIYYPKKGPLEILAFDEQLTVWSSQKDLCNICDQCFTKLPQSQSSEKIEIEPSSLVSCEIFTADQFVDFKKKIYMEIDKMEISTGEKKQIKTGEVPFHTTTTSEQYARLCLCLSKCINGECDKFQEQQCETYKLLYEHHFL